MDDNKTRLPEDSNSSNLLTPGQAFGQYQVIRLLGRGGMGEVYEVEHRDLRSRHAIKLISPEILERAGVKERFKREAVVMARLRYPNIVHVDDFGQLDGRIWLRMELVGGEAADQRSEDRGQKPEINSLSDLLGEPLPEKLVVDQLTQILDALAYAHEQGVVHRDLKPSNILLDGGWKMANREGDKASSSAIRHSSFSPTAKITDFGLVSLAGAEWFQSQVQLTVAKSAVGSTGSPQVDPDATRLDGGASGSGEGSSTEAMLGTFAYMSPEQKKGGEVDGRSDLYSVGKIAFQMLTGQDNIGFEMPSELVPALDPEWDDWLRKAVATRPDRRWANAEEMRDGMPGGDGKGTAIDPPPTGDAVREPKDTPAVGKQAISGAGTRLKRSTLVYGLAAFAVIGVLMWVLFAGSKESQVSQEPAEKPAQVVEKIDKVDEVEPVDTAPVIETGGVTISVQPEDAIVELEGLVEEHEGTLELKDVEVGEYDLEVSRSGYASHADRVKVHPGKMTHVSTVTLNKIAAVIEIKSNPSGASVYRDDQKIGTTPMRLEDMKDGEQGTFVLRKSGYESSTVRGKAESGRVLPLSAVLREYEGPVAGQPGLVRLKPGVDIELVWIPSGEFTMGSPLSEPGRSQNEGQHKVRLTDGFWMGKFEVTQAQWITVMGSNPSQSKFKTLSNPMNHPVERVSWNEAMEFCRRLTEAIRRQNQLPRGYIYSLPTESQWEYACRAGTTSRYYGGDTIKDLNRIAWTMENKDNFLIRTREVGQKQPNAWGLHDIIGNVAEWCLNDLSNGYPSEPLVDPLGLRGGPIKEVRGGSWADYPKKSRAAFRAGYPPDAREPFIGFRVALIPEKYQ